MSSRRIRSRHNIRIQPPPRSMMTGVDLALEFRNKECESHRRIRIVHLYSRSAPERSQRAGTKVTGHGNHPLHRLKKKRKFDPEELPADQILGAEWVAEHSSVSLPRDLARIFGLSDSRISISEHARNTVVPGVKHDYARVYFENLQEILENATHFGGPRAGTWPNQSRWEVYTPLDDNYIYLTIVGVNHEYLSGEIIASYTIKRQTLSNRLTNHHFYLRKP